MSYFPTLHEAMSACMCMHVRICTGVPGIDLGDAKMLNGMTVRKQAQELLCKCHRRMSSLCRPRRTFLSGATAARSLTASEHMHSFLQVRAWCNLGRCGFNHLRLKPQRCGNTFLQAA
eukprot:366512-Chlamydomonas_euryale.AAC.17